MNVVDLLNELIGKDYVWCDKNNNNFTTAEDSITIETPIMELSKMQKKLDIFIKKVK